MTQEKTRDLSPDQLAYLNRMIVTGHVLPNVAHELNNCLQVIGGLVEMLAARSDLPADVHDKIGRIGAQSARAVGLMRELVAFARRDDQGTQTFDLRRVVEQALSLRRYHLSRAHVAVRVEPEDGRPFRARGDAHAAMQALLNLLINAEQAVTGHAEPRIGVSLASRGPFVEASVIDNGPGMPADVAAGAGEPFLSLRAGTVGLGLAVARFLAESMGGELRVDATTGHGARVVVAVPRADA